VSVLEEGARELGIELSPAQVAQLDQLDAALREANQHFNLTRIVDPAEVETKHFLDSLTAALPLLDRLRAGETLRLVDVGAGAGFPGLPLKIVFPHIRLTLVESIGKKARFLRDTVEALGLVDVTVLAERSETAAREAAHRDTYDWATGRALGPLPVVIELCAPFLAPGGLLVAQRRGDLDAELLAAAPALKALQMWAHTPVEITLASLADGRGLVVAEKHGPTPEKYPRRPGMPAKEPIQREIARPHPPTGPRTGRQARDQGPARGESPPRP
jgi:16S rRNA (guanine527-N7)-methyltransferase